MEKQIKGEVEKGKADFCVGISKGTITVRRSSGEILHQVKNAKKGSWDKIWEAIKAIESTK